MNRENLIKTQDLLKNIDPNEFDMECIYNRITEKKCIMGLIRDYLFPRCPIYVFLGIHPLSTNNNHYNIWLYITGSRWSDNEYTNTIEHACYRIQRILDGYMPSDIKKEIELEIQLQDEHNQLTKTN